MRRKEGAVSGVMGSIATLDEISSFCFWMVGTPKAERAEAPAWFCCGSVFCSTDVCKSVICSPCPQQRTVERVGLMQVQAS